MLVLFTLAATKTSRMFDRYFISGLILLVLAGGALAQNAESGDKSRGTPIEITSDGQNSYEGGLAVATGNVIVHYGTDVLYAERITYDTKKKEVMADGNVRLYSGDKIYRGSRLRYNFENKHVVSSEFGLVDYPLFASGLEVESPEDNHFRITDGSFTTDNREHPAYRLKAHTVEIYPDDSVVLKNVVVFFGDVPVAWVPFYAQSLKGDTTSYDFRAGSTSSFGGFFYNTYNWRVDDGLAIGFHLDIRTRRGLGGGVDVKYKPTKEGEGLLKGYYASDSDFTHNQTAIVRSPVYKERYRFSLQQQVPFGNDIHTLLDLNALSDPYVTKDFFNSEYQHDRMPDNVGEATFYNPNFTASFLVRQQANRFQQTVDRLPEAKIETKRVKLFGTDLAYEGESSVVNFREQFSNQSGLQNFDTYRYDSYHELLYPKQYFSWLNFTPRLGGRGTYWSDDNLNLTDTRKDPRGRLLVDVGAESSFKVSKTWNDVEEKTLGIYGLRHVVEPFVNAQYIPRPDTNATEIRGFDSRVSNAWAQPINLSAYNSIDSLDRQAVIREGFRNKLQTKRDGRNYDLADWAIFTDFNLDRHVNEQNAVVNDKVSNLYNDLTLNPFPWLTFRSQSSIDTHTSRYAMSDNSLTWQATKFYEATLGNRYLNKVQIFDDQGLLIPNSDNIYLRNFYRINENWQFEMAHSFESRDGKLENMEYTVTRDLTAWQVALTYSQQDFRTRNIDHAIYATFTLKAFPEAKYSLSK